METGLDDAFEPGIELGERIIRHIPLDEALRLVLLAQRGGPVSYHDRDDSLASMNAYSRVRTRTMVGRALRRRCPRCGGKAFETYFKMEHHCDRCGLQFEREEGYWAGALIINTIVTFGTFLAVFIGGMVLLWPDVPWFALMAVTISANTAIPIAFYPISKTVWLALEMSWHPLESPEIEAAAMRATLPEFQLRDA